MSRPEQKPQNPPDSAQRCVQRAQNERTEDAEIERRTERDGGIEEQPQPPSANIARQRQQAHEQQCYDFFHNFPPLGCAGSSGTGSK